MLSRREALARLLVAPVVGWCSTGPAAAAGDLTMLTVTEAAAGIARRNLSPIDLTEAYLARIAAVNPDLNAFVTVTAERARTDARRAATSTTSSALRGIPIAHKDLFETAGIRTTAGSRLFDRHVPVHDAAVVARLSTAGAVLLGKTNMHELGGGVTTINPFYGTTRNPSDQTRIPGGSSGGSAAAVVARLAAAATGSDTGGSVRIPAALCGCVGFKPTFGWTSTAGLLGACPTFDHAGVLARTVQDAGSMCDAMSGRRFSPPGGTRTAVQRLRVGVARAFFFDGLEADVDRAMERAIERLRTAGAHVQLQNLPIDDSTMARVFDPIVASEIWLRYGRDWRMRPDAFSPAFAEFFAHPAPAAADVAAARRGLAMFQHDVRQAFDAIDVLLTPTVPVTAPPIASAIDGARILRNTWPFNAARMPAISLPCDTSTTGLPIGVQLAAPRGHDAALLRAAGAIEALLHA